MRLAFILSLMLSLCVMAGCASTPPPDEALLLPMPAAPVDPSDEILKQSLQQYFQQSSAPLCSHYSFRRVDLNNDGLRDAVVIVDQPYGYWCGINGCTALVMKAGDDSFAVLNSIKPVREPVFVSQNLTNGWKDIIVHLSGRWTSTKDVSLAYDGRQYPSNPETMPPAAPDYQHLAELFYN